MYVGEGLIKGIESIPRIVVVEKIKDRGIIKASISRYRFLVNMASIIHIYTVYTS